jgi:hypothetical protein
VVLRVAFALLLTWAAFGVLEIEPAGKAVHILLLIGLMLLLLGLATERDAADDRETSKPPRAR